MAYSFVMIALYGVSAFAAPMLDASGPNYSRQITPAFPPAAWQDVASLSAIEIPVVVHGGAPEIGSIIDDLRGVGIFQALSDDAENKLEGCASSADLCGISVPVRRGPSPHGSFLMGAPAFSKDDARIFGRPKVFLSRITGETASNDVLRSRVTQNTPPNSAGLGYAQGHGGAPSVDPVIEGLRDGKTAFRRSVNEIPPTTDGSLSSPRQEPPQEAADNGVKTNAKSLAIPVGNDDVELRELL